MSSSDDCASAGDTGKWGSDAVVSNAKGGVADGTTVDGGWALANHMITTPVAIPTANEMSAVPAGVGRRCRIRPIHIGSFCAFVACAHSFRTWVVNDIGRFCAFVARARSFRAWAVSDSMSLVCLDEGERVGKGVAGCLSTAEFWMRLAEAVTSLLPARVVIDDSGATITGGGVSEVNSESGSSMLVALTSVRSRRSVEPETMIHESGRRSKGILSPVTKANSVTLTPTSHGVKPVGFQACNGV